MLWMARIAALSSWREPDELSRAMPAGAPLSLQANLTWTMPSSGPDRMVG